MKSKPPYNIELNRDLCKRDLWAAGIALLYVFQGARQTRGEGHDVRDGSDVMFIPGHDRDAWVLSKDILNQACCSDDYVIKLFGLGNHGPRASRDFGDQVCGFTGRCAAPGHQVDSRAVRDGCRGARQTIAWGGCWRG